MIYNKAYLLYVQCRIENLKTIYFCFLCLLEEESNISMKHCGGYSFLIIDDYLLRQLGCLNKVLTYFHY